MAINSPRISRKKVQEEQLHEIVSGEWNKTEESRMSLRSRRKANFFGYIMTVIIFVLMAILIFYNLIMMR